VTGSSRPPFAVASDGCGRVFEIPGTEAPAMLLDRLVRPSASEWIPLPEGSLLFELPGRAPVVYESKRKRFETVTAFRGKPVLAAAAFVAPAYLRLYPAAWRKYPGAAHLPLYAYAPLGWKDGRFWTRLCGWMRMYATIPDSSTPMPCVLVPTAC